MEHAVTIVIKVLIMNVISRTVACLTEERLEACMRITTTGIKPDIDR
jgi:hypothetical protein